MFDLTDVTFVKRVTLGSRNVEAMRSEEEIEEAAALLNRCLSEVPRGRIIGVEMNFSLVQIGAHQVVLQNICYHIGFARRPAWLTG